MKIKIMSKLMAEKFVPNITVPHAVISITDPTNKKPAKFELSEYLLSVLYVKCYDIDFSDGYMSHTRSQIMKKYGDGLFTDEHAMHIANFVLENKDSIGILICHCDAGISRSSGVAAAIQRALTGDDKEIFNDKRYIPNMHVYRKVLDAFLGKGVTLCP